MALTDIKPISTPARMRNRLYVFAISSLAAMLLTFAFVKPEAASKVSQAVIRVPQALGPGGISPVTERIESIAFLRDVGAHHGITSGLDPTQIEGILDAWAHNARDALILDPGGASASVDGNVEIKLQYKGLDDEQSVSVMNSLLSILASAEGAEPSLDTPESRMRIRAAERRLGQAKQALELYINEELARIKESGGSFADSATKPVSINDPNAFEAGFPDLQSPVAMDDESLAVVEGPNSATLRNSNSQQPTEQDWLAEQKEIDEAANLNRNPEFDVLVRALVRSQAERQELLINFEPSHAAIRRVETEIVALELLVSNTKKYLDADELAESSIRANAFQNGAPQTKNANDDFDADTKALELIRQTEPFQKLAAHVQASQQELRNATDPAWLATSLKEVSVVEAPRLTSSRIGKLPWSKLLLLGGISSLLGFVMSRLGDSGGVPSVLYSILDVNQSLDMPVIGQLSMEGVPPVPKTDRVASVTFWRSCVRLAECVALIMLVAFGLIVATQPSILAESFANPFVGYMHAFQELRNYVPIPYLFR